MPAPSATVTHPAPESPLRCFVAGATLRPARPGWRDALCLAVMAAVIGLPLRGLYAATGSTMEEAFMLVFPQRLVAGDIPNVDFLHLYGPGSLDALAGWYGVFGHSLASERTFGLLQHVAIIAAVFVLTKVWGHVIATTCAITCTLLVLTPIGLSALAWEGGVALGLWSVVFALRGDATSHRRRADGLTAGILAGLALSFRPDLIVALALAHGWLLLLRRPRPPRAASRQFLVGAVVGILPVVVHLAMAGIGPSFEGMVLDPVVHLRPGRELPRPPSWSVADGALQAVAEGRPPWWRLPALGVSRQLFLWFFAMIVVALANIVVARRRLRDDRACDLGGRGSGRAVILMATSLFGLGLVQQGLQRPDSTHLAWVTCVSFSVLPAALYEVFRRHLRGGVVRPRALSIASITVVLLVICPYFTFRAYLLHSRVSVGNLPVPFEVRRDGRQFWVGDYGVGVASNAAVRDLAAMSRPGERLLVGPADLARTIYSDVMFYYFFPELTPATYFIEMDPGLADEPGSRLAADVRSADWVILTNFWTGWHEPNASSERGSDAPNQVVADDFCLVGNYEDALVLLYHRCAHGDGVSPAEVGGRSARVRAAGG